MVNKAAEHQAHVAHLQADLTLLFLRFGLVRIQPFAWVCQDFQQVL